MPRNALSTTNTNTKHQHQTPTPNTNTKHQHQQQHQNLVFKCWRYCRTKVYMLSHQRERLVLKRYTIELNWTVSKFGLTDCLFRMFLLEEILAAFFTIHCSFTWICWNLWAQDYKVSTEPLTMLLLLPAFVQDSAPWFYWVSISLQDQEKHAALFGFSNSLKSEKWWVFQAWIIGIVLSLYFALGKTKTSRNSRILAVGDTYLSLKDLKLAIEYFHAITEFMNKGIHTMVFPSASGRKKSSQSISEK